MSAQDFLRQTLEYYRQQKQKKLEELRPIELTIRQIELELGETPEAPPHFDLLLQPNVELNGERRPVSNGKKPDVRGDEFFSMSQAEAARTYLNKVGHAVPLDELVEVLNKGGCPVGGVDPKKTMYIALIRNTKDFVRIPSNGYIGLRSRYAGLKALPKTTTKQKAKARKNGKLKLRARLKSSKSAKAIKQMPAAKSRAGGAQPVRAKAHQQGMESPQPKTPSPVKATMREILGNGELYSGDAIVKAVQEKLGPDIRGFTVYGILKNQKEFEKVDDQYRLIK
jgi:hypothetical protein